MDENSESGLPELLKRRVAAVKQEVLRSGDDVSPEQVESLSRLAKLAEIDRATSPPIKTRWPIAAMFASLLAVVSLLFFAHVPETDIELDLQVSEVSFTLPTNQVIAGTVILPSLGISGLRDVQIPPSRSGHAQSWGGPDSQEFAIRLSPQSLSRSAGTITLAPFLVPADTRVTIRRMTLPLGYRLSLQGKEFALRVDVNGLVRIERSNAPAIQFDFIAPQAISLKPASTGLSFDFPISEPSQIVFSSQLPVQELSLAKIEQFLSSDHSLVRQISTILSGVIYFQALNDREYKLRAGEVIAFESSPGEIRTLQLHGDHIALGFHGRVRGMTTGTGSGRRSLMPTWLEWLKAQHGLSLLWGSAAYLFTVAAGVIRWWEK